MVIARLADQTPNVVDGKSVSGTLLGIMVMLNYQLMTPAAKETFKLLLFSQFNDEQLNFSVQPSPAAIPLL
jgi:hypothetical protein